MTLSYDLQLDLGTNFNTACCFLSFHRQLKTRLLFPHTNTLYQPVKTGKKAGEMTQQIKPFFHTHQECSCGMKVEGVSMTTTHFSNSDKNHCWI